MHENYPMLNKIYKFLGAFTIMVVLCLYFQKSIVKKTVFSPYDENYKIII